jgi:hypothetical protein
MNLLVMKCLALNVFLVSLSYIQWIVCSMTAICSLGGSVSTNKADEFMKRKNVLEQFTV